MAHSTANASSLTAAPPAAAFALIALSGADQVSFLNALITNSLLSLPQRKGQRNLLLDRQGKIIASFWLWKRKTETLLLLASQLRPALLASLKQYRFSETVTFHSLPHSGLCVLQAEEAALCRALELPEAAAEQLRELSPWELFELKNASSPADAASLFLVRPPLAMQLNPAGLLQPSTKKTFLLLSKNWQVDKTRLAAKKVRLSEADLTTWQANRLAAGELFAGIDYPPKTSALFLPIPLRKESVSLGGGRKAKGCFPGQEILAKAQSRGQVGGRCFQAIRLEKAVSENTLRPYASFAVKDAAKKTWGVVEKIFFPSHQKDGFALCLLPSSCPETVWLYGEKTADGSNPPSLSKTKEEQTTATPFRGVVVAFPVQQTIAPAQQEEMKRLQQAGLECFHRNALEQAREKFEAVLALSAYQTEALEALAVVYEKQENFSKALQLNLLWSELSPTAVMARANLSRLYMRLGFIEKAEAEKQKATLLSFKASAREAHLRKTTAEGAATAATEAFRLKQAAERKQKRQLFEEVLAVDKTDVLALFGLGKLHYEAGQYQVALTYLERALAVEKEHSLAYLFAARALRQLGRLAEAAEQFAAGKKVAKKRGELMPLKAMESEAKEISG